MIEFNVEDRDTRLQLRLEHHPILVQLTQAGKQELERQHKELAAKMPCLESYVSPMEDDDGWSRWTAHSLFNQLGHMFCLDGELPFNPNIKVEI